MSRLDRREWLQRATTIGAGIGAGIVASGVGHPHGLAAAAQTVPAASAAVPDTTKFFPGFKPFRVKTSGAEINGVIGGQGPPVLLLHGAPQMHITWRLVAPRLAGEYTVVVP